ncbi:MAG: PfkB family carbohydrate kinase [Spirochaetia bacterium]|jgi:sugar/nucleoside kinase (ribokinase family)|nr:PfkB family carbohydrate kinase [Spirochaetia bacterium]
MFSMLCIGDNVVDINYDRKKIYPGGNCVNVSVYVRSLGYDAAYVGVLADDAYAKLVRDVLDSHHIDRSLCPIKHGETGRCSCKTINGDRILTDENDLGLVKSSPLLISDAILRFARDFSLIHTSCYSFIDGQLEKLKGLGIPLIYDFSDLWDEKKIAAVCPNCTYALFSVGNLDNFNQNKQLLKQVVDKFNCELSIATLGADGAWVYYHDKEFFLFPYNRSGKVFDTTGCGDAWISGFIATYQCERDKYRSYTTAGTSDFHLSDDDENDFSNGLIPYCMHVGNYCAAKIAKTDGALGYFVPFADWEE